jgi:hypothetical protein
MHLAKKDEVILLEFKPKTPHMSDGEWLLVVELSGSIMHALRRCFWRWREKGEELGLRDKLPDKGKDFYSTIFGDAGASAYVLAQNTPRMFYLEMVSQEWGTCELGELGEWAENAGVDAYTNQLVKVMLSDYAKKP